MTKEKLITRTITLSTYSFLAVDLTTKEVLNDTVTLVGEELPTTKAIPAIQSKLKSDSLKIVTIDSCTSESVLVGLSESLFYELGEVISHKSY